jgi:hypothetical protein
MVFKGNKEDNDKFNEYFNQYLLKKYGTTNVNEDVFKKAYNPV